VERVYGPDLMLAVCDAGRAWYPRHYLCGGIQAGQTLRQRLQSRFPGLNVVGTFTPPFRALNEAEEATLRSHIAQTRPDVLWVGLSSPKQEKFMARYWREFDTGVLIGVGAAFDFHSGRVRQAPRWMQRSGFEWLFRFCLEPRRSAGGISTTAVRGSGDRAAARGEAVSDFLSRRGPRHACGSAMVGAQAGRALSPRPAARITRLIQFKAAPAAAAHPACLDRACSTRAAAWW
jgi:exopolysaccharide biosynthesis WecB/TagA/CpsF family protein